MKLRWPNDARHGVLIYGKVYKPDRDGLYDVPSPMAPVAIQMGMISPFADLASLGDIAEVVKFPAGQGARGGAPEPEPAPEPAEAPPDEDDPA